MKHPADMTLEELIAIRDELNRIAGQADSTLKNAVGCLISLDNRISAKVGLPLQEGENWNQEWAEQALDK